MKNKNIEDLEEKLKEKTGENKLIKGFGNKTSKKRFNVSKFAKLAKEMRKIFAEDERNTNPAF